MTDIKDIYWLAGLLEGEGTFYVVNERYPCMQYGSSDRDIVYRAAMLMMVPGKITEHKSKYRDGHIRKKHYRLSLSGSLAAQWMMTIYSLMSVRRKSKIKEVLTVWQNHIHIKGTSEASIRRDKIKSRAERRKPSGIICPNPFDVTKNMKEVS